MIVRRCALPMNDRDLYAGLVRLHVLHHAAAAAIYGQEMIDELAHHGYQLSPGTLYPLLHGLEKKGYLTSVHMRVGKIGRRMYRITPQGRRALTGAKRKVRELFGELFQAPTETSP